MIRLFLFLYHPAVTDTKYCAHRIKIHEKFASCCELQQHRIYRVPQSNVHSNPDLYFVWVTTGRDEYLPSIYNNVYSSSYPVLDRVWVTPLHVVCPYAI